MFKSQGFGWSLGSWGGQEVGAFTTVLSADISAVLQLLYYIK
jgi:hypothetical protein